MSDKPGSPDGADAGPAKKTDGRVRLVWIVTPRKGLHQVAAGAVEAALSNDQGRRATARDLDIAGVASADPED